MKRLLVLLLLALFAAQLSGCAGGMSSPQDGAEQPPDQARSAPLPKMAVGDYWEYRFINNAGTGSNYTYSLRVLETKPDGSFRAQYVNKDKKLGYVRNYDDKYVWRTVDGRDGERIKVADEGQHHFPLWVGKRWRTFFKAKSIGGQTETYVNDYSVVSYEKVTVPAGQFEAFKVRYDQGVAGQKQLNFLNYYWYAPKVKTIVKDQGEKQSIELINYRVSGE